MLGIKKTFNCIMFGAAALAMTAGGFCLSPKNVNSLSADTFHPPVVNELPDIFDQSDLNDNDTYFTADSVPIKFLCKKYSSTDDEEKYIYKFVPDETKPNHYFYYDITSLEIKVNGTNILEGTTISLGDLILTSSVTANFGSNDAHNNLSPETLDFKIKHGSELKFEKNELNENVLSVPEYGMYEIKITYNEFDTTRIDSTSENPDDFTEEYILDTTGEANYTFFLLDQNKYFETDKQDSPKLGYTNLTRTDSDSKSTHRHNYFYNYDKNEIPYISYNPNDYRLTLTKNVNDKTEHHIIEYDPSTKTASVPNFVKDLKVSENGDLITIYFNDIGYYNIAFEMLYTRKTPKEIEGKTENDYYVYNIDYPLLQHKVYLFGSQLYYTDYSNNQFAEFKLIKDNQIEKTANWFTKSTDEGNLDGFKKPNPIEGEQQDIPVKTDQTPIRLSTYASGAEPKLYMWNGSSWAIQDSFSVTDTINKEGIYFLTLNYTFSSYTNQSGTIQANQEFSQAYYFEINKLAPEVDVTVNNGETDEPLYNGKYTNKEVTISYDNSNNDFNSEIKIKVVGQNYNGAIFLEVGNILTLEKQPFTVTENGKYTIYTYYGKQDTSQIPLVREFYIDTEPISGLTAHSVIEGSVSKSYYLDSVLDNQTNQNFVFSWNDKKPSGASTFAKVKYLALNLNDYYNTPNQFLLIQSLLENDMLAATRTLNVSGGSWIDYRNAKSFVDYNTAIPSSYVKSSAGLYILQVFDSAGNSAVKMILLDDSQPLFILETADSVTGATNYSVISSQYTLTNDAVLHWASNKAIRVEGEFENTDYRGNENSELTEAFNKLNIKNITGLADNKHGDYLMVPIDPNFAIKDRSSNDFKIEEGKSFKIQFSYTIHYTESDQGLHYYFSTSTNSTYIDTVTGELVIAENGFIGDAELLTASIYLYRDGKGNQTYYYGIPNSLTLNDIAGGTVTATKDDTGKLTVNGVQLQQVSFVDMDGEYIFLIRDASNTKGSGKTELEKFRDYASSYQSINVSGDLSETKIYFKNNNGDDSSLSLASYNSILPVTEDGVLMRKNSFYKPTSINKILNISFVPTIKRGENLTQVESVTLKFYPYETKTHVELSPDGTKPIIHFYRTLATEALFEKEVYSFEKHGASEKQITEAINIANDVTTAGKYVLERVYKNGLISEDSDKKYYIDIFDYSQISLTANVDRHGVLTSPEVVSYKTTQRDYTYTDNGNDPHSFKTVKFDKYLFVYTTEQFFDVNEGTNGLLENGLSLKIKSSKDSEFEDFKGTPSSPAKADNPWIYDFENLYDYEFYYNDEKLNPTISDYNFGENSQSLESVVGKDIFISMCDGISDSNIVSITFPSYNGSMPSGETLYTDVNDNWKDNENPKVAFTTNKLPLSLYIPQYKYTIFNNTDEYKSNPNNNLNFYDPTQTSSVITPYLLQAEVLFSGESGEKRYISNGVNENGYLTFCDAKTGENVKQFTQSGTYYVTITQDASGVGTEMSENSFRKNYRFAFNISTSAPEFNVSAAGKTLSSPDASLITEGEVASYYTNSKTATISWQDSASKFIANVNKEKITLTLSAGASSSTSVIKIDENGKPKLEQGNIDISALSYEKIGKDMNHLTVNFEALGLYKNGASVQATLEFEGHNDQYYKKSSKRIVIDKTADSSHIVPLINKLSSFSSGSAIFDVNSLRSLKDVEGKDVDNLSQATYNVSRSIGNFKNYNYLVNDEFFITLAKDVQEAASLGKNYLGQATKAYYRHVENPFSEDFIETSYDNFAASAFKEFDPSFDVSYLQKCAYYEIVEEDLAGNLTIYQVYYFCPDGDKNSQGIEFEDFDETKSYTDTQIKTGKLSLFSTTNFSLTRLNFLGDRWLIFSIAGNEYMLSPHLSQDEAYLITNQDMQIVKISTLFSQFTSSASPILLKLSNRNENTSYPVNLTLLDGAALSTSLSTSNLEEHALIGYSNSVYPIAIKIYQDGQLKWAAENNPNDLTNLSNSAYNFIDTWTSLSDGNITITNVYPSRLKFAFAVLPSSASTIKYEITDNFGNVTKLTHIFGQRYFKEIDFEGSYEQKQNVNDQTTGGESVVYHISSLSLTYTYNEKIHSVKILKWVDGDWQDITGVQGEYTTSRITAENLVKITFSRGENELFSNRYKIQVFEKDENGENVIDTEKQDALFVKDIYLQVYRMLPHLLLDGQNEADYPSYLKLVDQSGINITGDVLTDDTPEKVQIGDNEYTVTRSGSTFASRMTVAFGQTGLDYPFKVKVHNPADGSNSGWSSVDSGSVTSTSGIYYFLIKYTGVLNSEYALYKIELLDSATEFYRVTNNGRKVEKSGSYYMYEGVEYSDYYIVNVDYNENASYVKIVPNDYQNIEVTGPELVDQNDNVATVKYMVSNFVGTQPPGGGLSPYQRLVFITFIPPTNSPVTTADYTFTTSEQITILDKVSLMAAVDKNEANVDSIKIRFSKYYGIKQNLIKINLLKDGVPFETPIYNEINSSSEQAYSYIILNRSGTYHISLSDVAGNVQTFPSGSKDGSKYLKLVLLKDVAFTMTFTDANGELVTTDPIERGVFENSLDLTLLSLNEYYTAQSTGSGEQMITALKNGSEYTGYTYNAATSTFTFNEPGYYTVRFSATATNGTELREQDYHFTIVNPDESRYSFEFAPYDGYYIKSIVKDDLGDITDRLKSIFPTIIIDGKEYLKQVITSSFDNHTGDGKYTITLSTGSNFNRTDYSQTTEITFSYWINSRAVPISVSIIEGQVSKKPITVSFNAERVFEAVGECNITIGNEIFTINAESVPTLGTISRNITKEGTYFITVRSTSGNLLYSYKVIKEDPLNGWAIAAIVLGVIGLIVAIVIIFKLRKRIKVK